jgi:hypothetical protein
MKRTTVLALLVALAGVSCSDLNPVTGPVPPFSLQKISGDDQTGAPGATLADPYVVRVVDGTGAVVPDEEVVFSLEAGDGGSISAGRVFTDSSGDASVTATLPNELDVSQTVEARIRSTVEPLTFTSRTRATSGGTGGGGAGTAVRIRVVSGDSQKGITRDTLLDPLVVEVTDAEGVTVDGTSVQWAVVSHNGGSVRSTPTTSDALGLSSNRVRAGDLPGAVDSVIAWIEPSDAPPDTVLFTADITGVPDTIVIVQGAVDLDHDYGAPEYVVGDTSFAAWGHWARQPFKGIVLDVDGRTVRGATLTWTVTNWFGKVGDEPDGPGSETVMVNTAEDGSVTVWRRACLPGSDPLCPDYGNWVSATLSIEDYPEVVPITLMALLRP